MPDETRIENFGRNVVFSPRHIYAPKAEADLLLILEQHEDDSFRVGGSLHAWSEAAKTDSVFIDLKHLNDISVDSVDDMQIVTVGGGCTIHRLLHELRVRYDLTMPALGLIDKQTIAGAISTGTHGSGRHSLSHYVRSVRVASFDRETGHAVVTTILEGKQLRAARCSLGCMGIILSVCFEVRPTYNVEEVAIRVPSVREAIALEPEYPLQQFYLIPWSWEIFTHSRRESNSKRSWQASIYRWHWLFGIDIGIHLIVCFLSRTLQNPRITKFFYRHILKRLLITRWSVVDRSDKVLTMAHDLFRHIEIELFVSSDELEATMEYTQCLLGFLGGERNDLPEMWTSKLETEALLEPLQSLHGTYTHHYPICVRKVLPDDTLISMASGDEPRYALSFISYHRVNERDPFFAFAEFLAYSTSALFSARPHWGKVCPLDDHALDSLYPGLLPFRAACQEQDPSGRFASSWAKSHLGVGRSE